MTHWSLITLCQSAIFAQVKENMHSKYSAAQCFTYFISDPAEATHQQGGFIACNRPKILKFTKNHHNSI